METVKLKNALKPLYQSLVKSVSSFTYDKAYFCVQWGKKFPKEKNKGLMFVGRAVNGWISKNEDVDIQFGDTDEAIFNIEEQMIWVYEQAGEGKGYNSNRSAFWRVIQGISDSFYPSESLNYVAWSNVCKVSPWEGGNPDNPLYYAQLSSCQEIFKKEVEILSPKVVIFFTGEGWAIDFLKYLNGEQNPKSVEKVVWDKKYKYQCVVYNINGTIYILSEHPQGKKEKNHIQCIKELIEKYSK